VIVKIMSRGKSFKGLATYLTHDPDAETKNRVGWTHTFNLGNDDVPSAVHEMLWTSRHAELLKQEAGIRAGGRATENSVKHLSLNWSPEDKPTRDHMIETTEDFLRHMKWHEHQAILVAHEDKSHPHVHVVLNTVHPETGLQLNDDFERRRAQAWALEYERENGRIYCEQRLKNAEEREDSPTRPAWMAFQDKEKEFERAEKSLGLQDAISINEKTDPKMANAEEWKILKELQKDERLSFFEGGKLEFSHLRKSIYREVREEFRDRWSDYYTAKKNGADVAELKSELLAEQKAILDERRDEACKELRENRNGQYRELLDDQRDIRVSLSWRQEAGFENSLFLKQVAERDAYRETPASFREAADEVTKPREGKEWNAPPAHDNDRLPRDGSGMKSGINIGAGIGESVGFGLISLLEGFADGVMGAQTAPRRPPPERETSDADAFRAAAEEAQKQQQQRDKENADRDDWYRKQRSLPGE
jgi:Relaxase/Mobilisation nuclease domain